MISSTLTITICTLLAMCLFIAAAGKFPLWIMSGSKFNLISSPIDNGLTFSVEVGDLVAMTISDTTRYDMTEAGDSDFAALMPSGGHVVHVGGSNASKTQTFTVALFHQLKCLQIYHLEYRKPMPRQVTPELRGCLNYLRQSLLCHADTRLESVKNADVQASKQYDTVCRDWSKVYEEAERNFDSYRKFTTKKANVV